MISAFEPEPMNVSETVDAMRDLIDRNVQLVPPRPAASRIALMASALGLAAFVAVPSFVIASLAFPAVEWTFSSGFFWIPLGWLMGAAG